MSSAERFRKIPNGVPLSLLPAPGCRVSKVKTGIDEIPNLRGLIAAIHKKESSSQYLADLQKIRKAYVQDVKENYSTI